MPNPLFSGDQQSLTSNHNRRGRSSILRPSIARPDSEAKKTGARPYKKHQKGGRVIEPLSNYSGSMKKKPPFWWRNRNLQRCIAAGRRRAAAAATDSRRREIMRYRRTIGLGCTLRSSAPSKYIHTQGSPLLDQKFLWTGREEKPGQSDTSKTGFLFSPLLSIKPQPAFSPSQHGERLCGGGEGVDSA